MPGRFVTFEGGDGSGKSTQLTRLAARLARLGIEPVVTREPGGTALAESIRALLLDPERRPEPLGEAFLMEAARSDLVARVIAPALAQGRIVLGDRYTDSTMAYQGHGRGLDLAMLRAWNAAATGGRTPDLTFLFDLPASDRIDQEPLEFHERVRRGYLELARAEPGRVVVIEAALNPRQVEDAVWGAVQRALPNLSQTNKA
ncbi:MAG: dTMP kinase [Candidatus Eisenbacteria bacterium]|uniref:Thymidylate kinase n=1 Tax=Eiseniibacteriota bacterium TaxID=2212470 RepID=A0A538U3W2_UNCEI|nr:MAG: dTMP kinase [Candidatus Eisenbacteria bacterium]